MSDEVKPQNWNEYDICEAAKRCGIRRPGWMGDWFTSWSPRNDNMNAEGTWAHWCNLAAFILSHPATEKAAPHLFQPELKFDPKMYASGPVLTEDEIEQFFPKETTP